MSYEMKRKKTQVEDEGMKDITGKETQQTGRSHEKTNQKEGVEG